MYVRAYEEGKSKRPFDFSACILVEKKKGQGYNRQLSRVQLLHECVNTYKDACGVIKKRFGKCIMIHLNLDCLIQ